jgi:hypothetical protein
MGEGGGLKSVKKCHVLFECLLTENVLDGRFKIFRIHSEFEGQVGDVRAVADGRQLPVHVRRQFSTHRNFTIHRCLENNVLGCVIY